MLSLISLSLLSPAEVSDPFATLRAAYEQRDAELAASAYAENAEVRYRYHGAPEETHQGREAIRASFDSLFAGLDAGEPLDLNFRLLHREGNHLTGLYRLRVGRSASAYGRFAATLSTDGRFVFDESSSATREAFEDAAGPVRLAGDREELDRAYYGRLTGRYRLPDGCTLVVTRSIVRLFVRNDCTQQWRGLVRVSGREWTAGDRVLDANVTQRYSFAPVVGGASPSLRISNADGSLVAEALRSDRYSTHDVSFLADDGTRLFGTLYMPLGTPQPVAATVMVHGSGPQDRDGYASIIAVMADALAASGRTVLAYDKRGSGLSEGDGDRASFDMLARDAVSAMAFLRARPEVDSARVGLAGSSQAGWVAARAVQLEGEPADVLLLGAAGAALSVREQNLYNTDVQMRCAGLSSADRRLALAQQEAFFDFLQHERYAARLDALTSRAQARPALSDWLFPSSRAVDRTDGAWFNVLAVDYDPLPVWRRFGSRATFLFGPLDDATPTARAVQRLRGAGGRVRVLAGGQHLGLVAQDVCTSGLADLQQFSPELFTELDRFARPAT